MWFAFSSSTTAKEVSIDSRGDTLNFPLVLFFLYLIHVYLEENMIKFEQQEQQSVAPTNFFFLLSPSPK